MSEEKGKPSDEKSSDEVKSIDTDIDTPVSCFCCKKSSCRRLWHSCNSYWQLLSMAVLVTVYSVFGAIIFSTVERPNELRRIEESEAARNAVMTNIMDFLLNSTNLNLTEEEAVNLTSFFLELGQATAEVSDALFFGTNPLWDFPGAIFFSTTVITTIGMSKEDC